MTNDDDDCDDGDNVDTDADDSSDSDDGSTRTAMTHLMVSVRGCHWPSFDQHKATTMPRALYNTTSVTSDATCSLVSGW